MRALAIVAAVAVSSLATAGRATAAPPAAAIAASASRGAVPLTVTLDSGATAAHWDLGDGATAEGRAVTHTYTRPGLFRVVARVTSAAGETAEAETTIAALRVTLRRPAVATYGTRTVLRGRVEPALVGAPAALLRNGAPVGRGTTRRDGTFRFRVRALGPARFSASVAGVTGEDRPAAVRARVTARVSRLALLGGRASLVARVRPVAAGVIVVRVWRDGRLVARRVGRGRLGLRLPTGRPGPLRAQVRLASRGGWLGAVRTVRADVVAPALSWGARGPSVRVLERRLAELRYAMPGIDGAFGLETVQALLAFQKVNGLPWTGRADARTWRALLRGHAPRPRYTGPGTHVEVSKGRQYLLVVRDGRVELATHVSTGATGNTPLGHWRVYRKVTGWDWVLWYPLYFLRGFAIHGYPSVPSYPASHGCVRVPMWLAPSIWSRLGYGASVYVYW